MHCKSSVCQMRKCKYMHATIIVFSLGLLQYCILDMCVCVCVHVYVVYEDTNLYNDMGMT